MAFNFTGITCFGTKPNDLLLPNFGAAITGPPITISCWVRVGLTHGGIAAGNESETDPFSPTYRGRDMCIVGLSTTHASRRRKLVLGFSNKPFVAGVTAYTYSGEGGAGSGIASYYGICPEWSNTTRLTENSCYTFTIGSDGLWYPGVYGTPLPLPNWTLVQRRFYLRYFDSRGDFSQAYNSSYEHISGATLHHVAAMMKGTSPYERILYVFGQTFTDNLLMQGHTLGEAPGCEVYIGGYAVMNYNLAVSPDGSPNYGMFYGDISEVGIWNVELTDSELRALQQGVKPINVRTDNLIFYAPLTRDGIHDYAGGLTLASLSTNNAVPPGSGSAIANPNFIPGGITLHPPRYG